MIDAAIVGLGRWGRTLVEAVQGKSERLRFTRAVSRDPGRVRDFAGRHRLDVASGLAPILADPGVAAVVLATPHSRRVDEIVAVAAAGKAVFCEKPLCYGVAEIDALAEVQRKSGLALQIGYMKRFDPSYEAACRLIAGKGERLRYVSVEVNDPDAAPFVGHHPLIAATDIPAALTEATAERRRTQVEAARLLTHRAARMKDAGERPDIEAGMAKLFAAEAARFCAEEWLRIHGGYGYSKEYEIERIYRDAPLLLIGEGTSEIQRMVIGRKLLQRHKL